MKNILRCSKGHELTNDSLYVYNGKKSCKKCVLERSKKNYVKNRDKVLERTKEWTERNREKVNELARKRYNLNPDKYREQANKRYNREKRREQYVKNKDRENRRNKERQESIRKIYLRITALSKQKGCKYCPEKEIVCIDFHHREPQEKSFDVSDWCVLPNEKRTEEALQREIDKCDPVCSNCHRKLHAKVKVVGNEGV